MASGADHTFNVGFHDELKNRLGDGAEEITLVVLLKQLGEGHAGLGHRNLRESVVEVGKLHRDLTPRWPPRLHRGDTRNFHHLLRH